MSFLFLVLFLFITGCVFGSFFYVVGTRLPNNESLIQPSSHCIYCKEKLKWYDLIPIFSFLLVKGKCRYCQHKLSKEYILYEFFTGLLFVLCYLKFNISYEFFSSIILSSLLVLIFITDFKYMIILDSPLIISSILLLFLKYIYYGWNEVFFSLFCGILTFTIMFLIGKLGNILFKKESLGGGDIKFSFVMGVILSQGIFNYSNLSWSIISILSGSKVALIALIFATFLALPYAVGSLLLKKDNTVPFGPFLVSSTFIVYFFLEKFKYILYVFY